MASPLLEDGAIDGARGILINITGSSSLKLSEVNEASTIIQNAAHEDCNIIFGAVMDERMGDEVKITVIATGFKQAMPERRARMLSEAMAPGYEVPIRHAAGRSFSGGEPPRFASEVREAYSAQQVETARQVLEAEAAAPAASAPMGKARVGLADLMEEEVVAEADPMWDGVQEMGLEERWVEPKEMGREVREPELVPVAASVFDDDFFRTDRVRARVAEAEAVSRATVAVKPAPIARLDSYELDALELGPAESNGPAARTAGFTFGGYATEGESRSMVREYMEPEPVREAMPFAGASGAVAEHAETDELDIPAFLRRSR